MPPQQQAPTQARPAQPGGTGSVEMFRRAWPDILEELKTNKKFLWMMVAPNASVTGFDGRTLTVSFAHTGAMTAFTARQENVAVLAHSIQKVLGTNIELVIAAGGSAPAGGSGPKVDRRPEPAVTTGPAHNAPQQYAAPAPSSEPAGPERVAAAEPVHAPVQAPAASEVPAAPAPAAPAPVATPAAPAPQQVETPAAPAPAPAAPAPQPAPTQVTTESASDDPGYGEEPSWDSEPWDDGGGDWDASSVPVPEWESEAGSFVPGNSAAPAPESAATPANDASLPAAPPPVTPKGYVAPAPSYGAADRPVAPPPGASAATWGMPVQAPEQVSTAPAASSGAGSPANGGKLSRYQRLMNRANGVVDAAPRPAHIPITTDPAAGAWGNPADAPDFARPRTTPAPTPSAPTPAAPVVSEDTEFVPSDDDIEIEDSSLIGVPAIERLLNGRIIEERDAHGTVIERPNRPR